MPAPIDERWATKDIDAVFVPKNEVYAAAGGVAAALDLPDGWLNDAVKGFLLDPDRFPTKTFEMPGLRCEVASAETVLVLKCLAHRLGDDDDEVVLRAAQLGLDTADDVLNEAELRALVGDQPWTSAGVTSQSTSATDEIPTAEL